MWNGVLPPPQISTLITLICIRNANVCEAVNKRGARVCVTSLRCNGFTKFGLKVAYALDTHNLILHITAFHLEK